MTFMSLPCLSTGFADFQESVERNWPCGAKGREAGGRGRMSVFGRAGHATRGSWGMLPLFSCFRAGSLQSGASSHRASQHHLGHRKPSSLLEQSPDVGVPSYQDGWGLPRGEVLGIEGGVKALMARRHMRAFVWVERCGRRHPLACLNIPLGTPLDTCSPSHPSPHVEQSSPQPSQRPCLCLACGRVNGLLRAPARKRCREGGAKGV